jgi:hypothetical protein
VLLLGQPCYSIYVGAGLQVWGVEEKGAYSASKPVIPLHLAGNVPSMALALRYLQA